MRLLRSAAALVALAALLLVAALPARAADGFASYNPGLDSPGGNAAAVTPADGADLATVSRGIYVGATGDVSVIMALDSTNSGAGTAVTFVAVPTGTLLPIRARRVKSTGTTATSLVAVW